MNVSDTRGTRRPLPRQVPSHFRAPSPRTNPDNSYAMLKLLARERGTSGMHSARNLRNRTINPDPSRERLQTARLNTSGLVTAEVKSKTSINDYKLLG